jgi:high affinity Mn2+ porin
VNEKLFIALIILVISFSGGGRLVLAADSAPTAAATALPWPSTSINAQTPPTSSPTQREANVPDQIWNWHTQGTVVGQGDPPFAAKYSGPQSLFNKGEVKETISLDLFAGVRLWSGAEAHVDGLMWQGFGLTDTLGIEAFPSGNAYKLGTDEPYYTFSRLFIRQTIGLGGEQEAIPDDQLTLAGARDVSRLTFTIGRFSMLDIFDHNNYAQDPETQFLNWAMIGNLAWDYPADAVGYTTGVSVELNQPHWALRYGFFQMPRMQNGFTAEDQAFMWRPAGADGPVFRSWGMVMEFERRYGLNGHPGVIRLLPWLNEADMYTYHAATSILRSEGAGANLSALQAYRYKYGFGLNWEQEVTESVGLFSRLGWNDGMQESWVYTDVNWTASLGVSIKGEAWKRSDDFFGLGGVIDGASHENQEFLEAGGLGILDGDGALTYGTEKVVETYYDLPIWKIFRFALDYQFVSNPAFNRDRGPVSVFGARLHWEL